MFARLATDVLVALPVLAAAHPASQCSTGPVQCCNSVQSVRSAPVGSRSLKASRMGVDGLARPRATRVEMRAGKTATLYVMSAALTTSQEQRVRDSRLTERKTALT